MRTPYASKFVRQLVVNLPVEPEQRLRWVAIVLQHISEARRVAPWVTWLTVEIDGKPAFWREGIQQYVFLQAGVQGDRGEAHRSAVPLGPLQEPAQGKESEEPCCDARGPVLTQLMRGGRRINGTA